MGTHTKDAAYQSHNKFSDSILCFLSLPCCSYLAPAFYLSQLSALLPHTLNSSHTESPLGPWVTHTSGLLPKGLAQYSCSANICQIKCYNFLMPPHSLTSAGSKSYLTCAPKTCSGLLNCDHLGSCSFLQNLPLNAYPQHYRFLFPFRAETCWPKRNSGSANIKGIIIFHRVGC